MNTVTSPIGRYRRKLIKHWPGFRSQGTTAARLGVSEIHYAQIESGKANCSEQLAKKIARLFSHYSGEKFTLTRLKRMITRARHQYYARRFGQRRVA
jgi:DNA-binding XRE family transcriptional regulator